MTKLTLKTNLSLETQAKLFRIMGKGSTTTPASTPSFSKPRQHQTILVNPAQEIEKVDKIPYAEKIKTIQKWLEETFPQAFNLKAPKPLKRRIESDILPLIPKDFTKTQLRQALTAYTNRKIYLEAIITNDWRYDLKGDKIEEISVTQKGHTHQKLALKKQPRPVVH